MRNEPRRFQIDNGAVSGLLTSPVARPPGGMPAVVLAHGAGNDMHQRLLEAVAAGLARQGHLTVRFNFPYKEHGGRAPDRAPVLEACYRSVIDHIRAEFRPRQLVIGGKSLGGRMASHLAATETAVDGLIFLGYPLHPAGRPEALRAAHLTRIRAPMLFFAGTRDPLCRLDLLARAVQDLPAVTLHVIQDGDHSFEVPKRTGRSQTEVEAEIVGACADWLSRLP